MVATARRTGGWESIGAELICLSRGFVQHRARLPDPLVPRCGSQARRRPSVRSAVLKER